MPEQRYTRFQTFIQQFATTRMGAWAFAHSAHHADRLIFWLSGGKATLATIVSGIPIVMLTTRGAKTGQSRTTPVLCVVDPLKPGVFAVIASNLGQKHNPAWFYNLKVHPHAVARLQGRARVCTAHEASDEEYSIFWQAATEIYPGYMVYKQRAGKRHIPIMVLVEDVNPHGAVDMSSLTEINELKNG